MNPFKMKDVALFEKTAWNVEIVSSEMIISDIH